MYFIAVQFGTCVKALPHQSKMCINTPPSISLFLLLQIVHVYIGIRNIRMWIILVLNSSDIFLRLTIFSLPPSESQSQKNVGEKKQGKEKEL